MKKTFAGMPHALPPRLIFCCRANADHPDGSCRSAISPVSPTLYGLMTEEINYSYDGGLYAEMVRNRTFNGDWSGILHWISSRMEMPRPNGAR